MSKVVIYVLDKIVWMLLITAVTTQALQIAGVVSPPNSLGQISYKEENEYNFQVGVGGTDVRGKRQTEQRSQFIDNLFNIPISTLNAVNNFVQNSRPAFQSLREYAVKRLERTVKAVQNNRASQRGQSLQVPSKEKNSSNFQ